MATILPREDPCHRRTRSAPVLGWGSLSSGHMPISVGCQGGRRTLVLPRSAPRDAWSLATRCELLLRARLVPDRAGADTQVVAYIPLP